MGSWLKKNKTLLICCGAVLMSILTVILYAHIAGVFLSKFTSQENKKSTRIYYIDELDVFMSIEYLADYDDGNWDFRINVSPSKNFDNRDYVEIRRPIYDLPSISFIYPTNDKKDIYILDRSNDVTRIQADKYKFKLMSPELFYDEKIDSLRKWKSSEVYSDTVDSVLHSFPYITIQLAEYINGLNKWVDGEWKGSIPVYETRKYKK